MTHSKDKSNYPPHLLINSKLRLAVLLATNKHMSINMNSVSVTGDAVSQWQETTRQTRGEEPAIRGEPGFLTATENWAPILSAARIVFEFFH